MRPYTLGRYPVPPHCGERPKCREGLCAAWCGCLLRFGGAIMGIAPRGSLVADTAYFGGLLLRRKPPKYAAGSSPLSSWAMRLPVGRCCAQDDNATLRNAHAPPNALWAYACRHYRITRARCRPRVALAGIPKGDTAHIRPSPHFHS